jgi:hypothetical protein
VYLIIGAVMKINIKHYSDEATHAANKQQRKNRGNNVYGEENVFNSDADVDGICIDCISKKNKVIYCTAGI